MDTKNKNQMFEIIPDDNIQIITSEKDRPYLSKIEMIDLVIKKDPTLANKYQSIIKAVKEEFDQDISYYDIHLYYNDNVEDVYDSYLSKLYG